MADEYKLPTALETLDPSYWGPKFVMSGVLLYVIWDSFSVAYPLRFMVLIPLLFVSFGTMSVTRVKPGKDKLMYRRFFVWRPLAGR